MGQARAVITHSSFCVLHSSFFLRDSPELQALFHCHALGQVPRLVHVAPAEHRGVVGQELQRDDAQQRLQRLGRVGDVDDVVAIPADLRVALGGYRDDPPAAGRTSSMLLITLSYCTPLVATNTTGIPSLIRAIGPCFISAAGIPSAWM